MISDRNTQNVSPKQSHSWSNRFFILAVAGILFLTMYPFELSHPKPYRDGSPLFLGTGGKFGGPLDIFLNILLFMPFGFALATKLLRNGKSWRAALAYTTLAGALFSYCIEVTQLYVLYRDSGWLDVLTNTTGSVLGFVAAFLFGDWLFARLTAVQQSLRVWLTPRAAAFVLLVYFAIWSVASAFLSPKVSLADWRTDCFLIFGNDASGHHPWNGHLSQVQIWDRALPKSVGEQLTSSTGPSAEDDPIVNLNFGNERAAASGSGRSAMTANASQTGGPVMSASPTLSDFAANRLKQTNQFSIRAVLSSPAGPRLNGRILSLTQPSGYSDFYLIQQNYNLLFWFRTPITARWRSLNWKIPDALATDGPHAVLFCYNGTTFSSYMDGKQIEMRAIGVQTALASYVRYLREGELKGYRYIFYALVFFPAGAFLGIAISRSFAGRADRFVLGAIGILLPAALFEWILTQASRGPFSVGNFAFSAMYLVAGMLWMNADGRARDAREASNPTFESAVNP
jgi:hypothetical protein